MKRVPMSLHRALAEAAQGGRAGSGACPYTSPGTASALAAQPVLTYATTQNADRYRRLMRVLWMEHRHFGLRLRPEEIADRAREQFGLALSPEEVAEHLNQLHDWRAVEREHDASLASTPREYRRSRFTYDITPAGRRVEELLAELDELHGRGGALDGSRLTEILYALHRLVDGLADEKPEPTQLRTIFEGITTALEQLHSGALDFMRSLDRIVARGELVDDAEFERCKGALLEHLQGFRRERNRHQHEIVEAIARIDRLGHERMAELIVSAEEIADLPNAPAASMRRGREQEIRDQWTGIRSWFVGTVGVRSPWEVLGEKVIQAIRAILDIAEAIVDRRTGRADRAHACVHLAQLAVSGDAQAVLVAALGIAHPRHGGTPHLPDTRIDPHESWWDAPPAPVVAHLRRPGARTPGAGSGTPIADTSAARARAAERREAEREELEQALARFARADGPLRLADVGRLREGDFRHLLAWLGRAFESPRDDRDQRHAWSADGRARITLHAPTDERVTIATPLGVFDCANYALEVNRR